MSIMQRVHDLRNTIRALEVESHRPQNSVQLLAVSKGQPVSSIEEAIAAGQTDFGENYCQEGIKKITALDVYTKQSDLIWHFIGPLQSNKVKTIATAFDWVHSIDRLTQLEGLNHHRPADKPRINVCIQVNLAAEDSKHGLLLEQLLPFMKTIPNLPRIQLRGLMLIPPKLNDPQAQYALFVQLKEQLFLINDQFNLNLNTLSMGMSHDYKIAIRAGSTLVRLGEALFGPRS